MPLSVSANLLDFFNGVKIGQVLPSAGLKYILNPPDPNARITLVYFWGTWCGPCREAVPSLNALQADRGAREFAVVAVTDESETDVAEFLKRIPPVKYSVALDDGRKLFDSLKIRALPYAVLLDKERKVIWRGQIKDLDSGKLDKFLSNGR